MKTVKVGDITLRMPCCSTVKDAIKLAKAIERKRERERKLNIIPKPLSPEDQPCISIVGFEEPTPVTKKKGKKRKANENQNCNRYPPTDR